MLAEAPRPELRRKLARLYPPHPRSCGHARGAHGGVGRNEWMGEAAQSHSSAQAAQHVVHHVVQGGFGLRLGEPLDRPLGPMPSPCASIMAASMPFSSEMIPIARARSPSLAKRPFTKPTSSGLFDIA